MQDQITTLYDDDSCGRFRERRNASKQEFDLDRWQSEDLTGNKPEATLGNARREGREATMSEIARVLKPGGRVVVHDIRYVGDYAAALEMRDLTDVTRVGSRVARIILLLIMLGSPRPDIVTARSAAA